MINIVEKVLEDIPVMYIKSETGPSGATEAFSKLEAKLPGLKGRKFYGLIFGSPPSLEYLSSVSLFPDDNPGLLGFQTWTIPGGRYAQTKLMNWSQSLEQIPVLFDQLTQNYKVDRERPSIEFYRSLDELLLRISIRE
ncbi:hypothetical protein A3H19_03325 [Candidatus Woesebacteria bacterium RIFCSPLOWO2_12_FULL_39_9]|nr:MAG: hypothetical protein A3H19_03325 [Candidatus Woesebacteria bacterium RIFCSPLOWO2_12_FULL_39_9]